jgi:hypothetical protein
MTFFDSSSHCRWRFQTAMSFQKIVISEIQSNRFPVLDLLAESVRRTRQAAAVHPQHM